MSKKKIILVDQDGVLANYQAHQLTHWRTRNPEEFWIPLEEITEHDSGKLYPPHLQDALESIVLQRDFFRTLPPIEGAREALEAMLGLGHDVRICTSPKRAHEFCVPEKYAWVEEHLGRKWTERIIMTRDKTLIHGDILIDDKPDITGIMSPTWTHILYDQPYNRCRTDLQRLTWKNYREVLEL